MVQDNTSKNDFKINLSIEKSFTLSAVYDVRFPNYVSIRMSYSLTPQVAFAVNKDITGNCQLSSISCFNNVLANLKPSIIDLMSVGISKEKSDGLIKEATRKILKTLATSVTGKPLFLFDVKEVFEPIIKSIFPSEVKFYTPYRSSNGSHMLVGIVDTSNIYL